MARLGKVARDVLLGACRAIGQASMVTVIELVRTGHCEWQSLCQPMVGSAEGIIHQEANPKWLKRERAKRDEGVGQLAAATGS